MPATTEAITDETLTHDTAPSVHRTAKPARTCERDSRPSGRALVLIALAALVLGACGGSDDDPGDAGKRAAERYDVKALAKAAFGPNKRANSGTVEGRIEVTVAGARGFDEPVPVSLSGPFRYRRGSSLPDYQFEMELGERSAIQTSVHGRSFIGLRDAATGYEIPAAVRRRLAKRSARGRNGLMRTLEAYGIAPWRWEKNRRFGAVETVDGVKTVRADTGVHIDRLLRDLNTLAEHLTSLDITRAAGLPPMIPARARRVLVRSLESARGSSWIAVDDHVLRKSSARIRFAIRPADRDAVAGISRIELKLGVAVTDVGHPRAIEPPADIRPFSNFQGVLDALGDFYGRS